MGKGWKGAVAGVLDPMDLTGAQARLGARDMADAQMQGTMAALMGNWKASEETAAGMGKSREALKGGFKEAKGYYESPEIVGSRAELYNRVLGKGGYSDETINKMKGNSIEQAGVSSRNVQTALSDRFGDSTGRGLAAENLARAVGDIEARKAGELRDVDIKNAILQEEQQTGGIQGLYSDAAARAGLSTDEARLLASLETALGMAKGGLSNEAGKMLAEAIAGSQATIQAGNLAQSQNLSQLVGQVAGAVGKAYGAGG